MPDIINVTCGEIQSAAGFEFKLPSALLNQTLDGDCEQSWYLKNGSLIADPWAPRSLSDPAVNVSSDGLVTSHCVDQLHHEIICDASGLRLDTMFRAWNCTSSASTQTHQSMWPVALVMIVLLMMVFICFMVWKRKLRDSDEGQAPCPEEHHHVSF